MIIIGWVGSLLFSLCAIPQAWQSWRQGHSDGLSWSFLLLWAGGEILTTIYVLPKWDWPLLANYAANGSALAVILWFKVRPR